MSDQRTKELDFLVYRLRQKDQEALSFLYDQYAANLKGVIIRIVNDESIAEELLQDAFLKIWSKIDQFDPAKGRLFTWMFQLSKNIARDYLRSRVASNSMKTGSLTQITPSATSDRFDESRIDSIGVQSVINELDQSEKEIIELMYLKSYTQAEIAEETGIPLGTVKTKARKAMKQLRVIKERI